MTKVVFAAVACSTLSMLARAEEPAPTIAEARADAMRTMIDDALLAARATSFDEFTPAPLCLDGADEIALALFQDEKPADATAASGPSAEAQANNPLANIVALNFQNYSIPELTDIDGSANQFVVRYAQPFSIGDTHWLLRASLPINSFPTAGGRESGLGDLNVFAAYLFDTGDPGLNVGLGPQITLPTASDDALGTGKTSLGLAHVLFDGRHKKFQWGYLLTWQASVAGPSDRADVDQLALQPFAFYQLGEGWYLRSAPIWAFNLDNGDYNVPLGLGAGKVFKTEKVVFNVFVEPQFSIANSGAGQAEWQIFAALNLQFPF